MIKRIFAMLALALAVSSCIREGDVGIIGIGDFNLDNVAKPELVLNIRNDSGSNIKVKKGRITVGIEGMDVLEAILAEKITIPKKSSGNITVPMNMRILNPLAMVAMGIGGEKEKLLNDITVSTDIVAKAGLGRINLKSDKMPLSEFFTIFGVDKSILKEL